MQSMWFMPWTRQFQGATQSVLTSCVQNSCKLSLFVLTIFNHVKQISYAFFVTLVNTMIPYCSNNCILASSSDSVFSISGVCYSAFQGREIGNEKLIGILDLQQISYKNIDPRGLITGFQFLQVNY